MRRLVILVILPFFLLGFVMFVGESGGPILAAQDSNRFVINVGGKYGFIDSQGSIVVPPQYSSVREFSEGLAVVVRDGKWGFIDTTGKEVIPLTFASASDFSEGVAIVDTGNDSDRAAFVDHRGKLTSLSCVPYSDNSFGFSGVFSEGLLPVRLDNHAAYIDRTCKTVIKTQGIRGIEAALAPEEPRISTSEIRKAIRLQMSNSRTSRLCPAVPPTPCNNTPLNQGF